MASTEYPDRQYSRAEVEGFVDDFLNFLDGIDIPVSKKVSSLSSRLDELGVKLSPLRMCWPGNKRAYETVKELYRPHLRTVLTSPDRVLHYIDALGRVSLPEKVIALQQVMTVGSYDFVLRDRNDIQAYDAFRKVYMMNEKAEPLQPHEDFDDWFARAV